LAARFRSAWTATSSDSNKEYRQLYFSSDVTQARLLIIVLALSVGLFIIGDYLIVGLTPIFYALLVLRIFLIAYAGFQIRYINR
jgi:two-component system, sensor histidine kinase PdtaS